MKKILLLSMCLLAFAFTENKANPYRPDRMFNYFYESLSPYGEWVEIDYDLYAWRPSYVRYNWSPYRDGRWIWTNHGWYWDSYEPFGWAVYHYGRWIYDDYYGWIWLPDNEWGPAWVEWRYDNNYIGWCPLPPYASFRINIGIHFSITWNSPHVHWTFVDVHHFHGVHVSRYIVRDEVKYRIFSKTKYRTNYSYESGRIVNYGVDRKLVERQSGSRINQRDVNYTSERTRDGGRSAGSSRSVSAYRPAETELARYEGRSEVKATRSERKSSVQVDRIENNIYRERTAERNNASGAARNGSSAGTATRERTDNNGRTATETVPAARSTGSERSGVQSRGAEKIEGGTKSGAERLPSPARTNEGRKSGGSTQRSGTDNDTETRSSGIRTAAPATSSSSRRISTPTELKENTSKIERHDSYLRPSSSSYSGSGESGNTGRSSNNSETRSSYSRPSESTYSAPAQRNPAPETRKSSSSTETRSSSSGSETKTQSTGRSRDNNSSGGTRSDGGRSRR